MCLWFLVGGRGACTCEGLVLAPCPAVEQVGAVPGVRAGLWSSAGQWETAAAVEGER